LIQFFTQDSHRAGHKKLVESPAHSLDGQAVSNSTNQSGFERRAIVSLASLYSVRMLGLFMLLPVLSLHGQDYQSATPFLLGVAMGAYGLSQALLQIPFGVLSDRLGRRPLILIGLLLFVAGSIVAAEAESVYGLILGRLLQGAGAISAVVMALVTDLTSDENRSKAMASIGGSIALSFIVAMSLGPMLAAWGGVASVFWVTAVLGVISLGIFMLYVPQVTQQFSPRRDALAVPQLVWRTFIHTELLRLNLGVFVLHFVLMANFVALPLILEQHWHIPNHKHGLIYLPLLLIAFALAVPQIIVAEKKRRIRSVFLIAIGLILLAEFWFMLLPASAWSGLLALFIFFLGFNVLEATQPSLVSKIAPVGCKGTATGIYATCQVMGVFLGALIGGWLVQEYGWRPVFLLGSIMAALWLLLAWKMQQPRFLASVLIPLPDNYSPGLAERLADVNGVAEVLIVDSERTAYLKVDQQIVDRKALSAIVDAELGR
jgi:predicted MFS family arabinose efflux permease